LPAASAFVMPSQHRLAEMFRRDLAVARQRWIDEAVNPKDREQRQRSDFMAVVNHEKERAVFYSMRHGHGTALADAGVAEKDIAASMHHASRTTTARYLHTGRKAVVTAVASVPDLDYPSPQLATGTAGPEPDPNNSLRLSAAWAAGRTTSDNLGHIGGSSTVEEVADSEPVTAISEIKPEKGHHGLVAELADAVDSKSTAFTGVSVRLRSRPLKDLQHE
jgi:hypothetical protein